MAFFEAGTCSVGWNHRTFEPPSLVPCWSCLWKNTSTWILEWKATPYQNQGIRVFWSPASRPVVSSLHCQWHEGLSLALMGISPRICPQYGEQWFLEIEGLPSWSGAISSESCRLCLLLRTGSLATFWTCSGAQRANQQGIVDTCLRSRSRNSCQLGRCLGTCVFALHFSYFPLFLAQTQPLLKDFLFQEHR